MKHNFVDLFKSLELPHFVFSKKMGQYYFFEMPIGQTLLLQLVNILNACANSQKLQGLFIDANFDVTIPHLSFDYEKLKSIDLTLDTFSSYNKSCLQSEKWELFSLFDHEVLIVAIEESLIEPFEQKLKNVNRLHQLYFPFDSFLNYHENLRTANNRFPLDEESIDYLEVLKKNYGSEASYGID